MEAKEAIDIGKKYRTDLFGTDLDSPPRLEEVWRDQKNVWNVIFGFYRKPDDLTGIAGLKPFSTHERKVVRVDDTSGMALSITDLLRVMLDH